VRPVSPKDMLASEDRVALHVAAPVDAMVRPEPANDIGHPEDRRRKGGPVGRALLALLSTLIIGLGAATWKSYGDAASKIIAGFVTQPVVASQQPISPEKSPSEKPQSEKSQVAAQPASTADQPEPASAASDQPAPAVQPVPATPASADPASSDSSQLLQSMARDLAALGRQVDELKADIAQMKTSQQQMAHDLARTSEPTQRPKTAALPPRPVAVQTHRPIQPAPSLASPRAAATQPAFPQVATAPYRSAPQAAAAPVMTTPYYGPPQRYVPPPPELPPQASAEPPDDQGSWAPRPPMPLR
jgi:hypothetical protein